MREWKNLQDVEEALPTLICYGIVNENQDIFIYQKDNVTA